MSRRVSVDELLNSTEVVDIDSVQQHPDNPRIGDEELIKKSIEYHGQFRAIGVSTDGYILFGNHTWLGMKLAGETKVVIHRLPFLHTDTQAKKILAADNRASDGSTYDMGLVRLVLEDIRENSDDGLEGSLFSDDYLLKLIAKDAQEAESDPDEAAMLPADPITQLGDVWLLGKHVLLCGDATDPESYPKILGDQKAHIMFTDPPYGVSDQTDMEKSRRLNHRAEVKDTDKNETEDADLFDFLSIAFELTEKYLEKGSPVYVCSPPTTISLVFGYILKSMEILHQTIIWGKDQMDYGRSDYHPIHELIYYGWTKSSKHYFTEDKTQNTLWMVDRPKKADVYPFIKPVELVTRALMNSSESGQIVLDPFAGTGTTLIAAQTLHRTARIIEIDPAYCDVICRRFQDMSGIFPVMGRTGEQYDFSETDNARKIT